MRTAALIAILFACAAGATTYQVGPARTHTTLASLPTLVSGDVVEIDPGTYNEVRRWTVAGVTVRGVGATKPVFDATGLTVDGSLPNPRAVFQVEADHVTIENVELVNARNGNNGAGVRVTGVGHDNVVLRGLYIHDNDMGIMSDGADKLLIDACEIAKNGTAMFDGFSHNFYLGGGATTIQYSYIHDATNGQNVKSRGHFTALLYNYIADSQDGEVGLVDEGTETTSANSNAVMIGNIVIAKPRLSQYNHVRFIQFGQDGGNDHNGTLYAFNNTFVTDESRIQFLWTNATSAHLVASNNVFYGSDTLVLSGNITGSNNCVPSTATLATLSSGVTFTSSPFVDVASRDFHLTAMSACRNAGAAGNMYVDGLGIPQLGIPASEYVNHLQHTTRAVDGMLDDGAYEYGSVADAGSGGGAGGGGGGGGGGGTGGGSGASGGGSGASGGGSASTGGGSASTGGGSASIGGGSASIGGGSASSGGGSASAGGGDGAGGGSDNLNGTCSCAAPGAAPLLLAFALVLRRRARSR